MRGGRRQLAGINTMLQQAGQQNAPERINVRGRGSRMAGDNQPHSGPPTPGAAPTDSRQESGYDLMNPPRADLITGGPPGDPRDRGRRDRPARHTQRESRSPMGDRIKRGPGDDERDSGYRDYRERKEGGRNDDRLPSRDGSRDIMIGGGRDVDRERDNHREPSGRRDYDGPWAGGDRGERGAERGGRGRDRDMHGDDRRGSRGLRDDAGMGRKRRSEEGMGERGHEGSKRARR